MTEDILFFQNPQFNDAIIGVTTDNRVVYDFDLMVESLINQDFCDNATDAIEFIDYNTIRICQYIDNPPIIIYSGNYQEVKEYLNNL